MLFLLYTNDIDAIASKINPFADDNVLYTNIRNQNDRLIFKNDVDTLINEKWLMELNYFLIRDF